MTDRQEKIGMYLTIAFLMAITAWFFYLMVAGAYQQMHEPMKKNSMCYSEETHAYEYCNDYLNGK